LFNLGHYPVIYLEALRETVKNFRAPNLPVWNLGLFNCRFRSTSYSTAQGVLKCSAVQTVVKNIQC